MIGTEVMVDTHSWFVKLGRVKRIWYLSPMRAAKVQASLRLRAVSPEPPLLAHTSSESRGTFSQKASLNGWACAVKICHDGMFEDTNSLDAAQFRNALPRFSWCLRKENESTWLIKLYWFSSMRSRCTTNMKIYLHHTCVIRMYILCSISIKYYGYLIVGGELLLVESAVSSI